MTRPAYVRGLGADRRLTRGVFADAPISSPESPRRTWLSRRTMTVRRWLPQGQLLPEPVWQRRHAMIVGLLWLHVVALGIFGLLMGNGPLHMLLESTPLIVAGLVARSERAPYAYRVAASSLGLITASAILVHLSNGMTEAHFHFFVVIAVLTLYQDWLPFLLGIGYVILHHGVLGVLAPRSVYSHQAAYEDPWRWALIHGGFVIAASAANVAAWRTSEDQLRDQLTGLPSRVLFVSRLTNALERRRRQGGATVAVLFLDLDGFKHINDSLGHPTGDRLIVAVADRLRGVAREHETIARLGGDEFALLCECSDESAAMAVAERVLEAFARPFELPHGLVFTAASLGIALSTDAHESCDDVIRNADAAMYRAKRHAGSNCVMFDEATHERARHRLEHEQALRHAVDREEFRVFFQPEVCVGTGKVVGFEALVRWQHPQRGLVGAGDFIDLAEETGLIVPIGSWVLHDACRRLQEWQATWGTDRQLRLSVNVSARQLADDALPVLVEDILAETGIAPGQLVLEITERMLIEDPERSNATLCALKDIGVRLAIDDFGTGYSSLEQLRRFPFDILKIDRSFIMPLPHSQQDAAIVSAVTALGRAFGLSVTAEGVETAEQLASVRAHDCDTAQGYLFSRPLPAAAVMDVVADVETRLAAREVDADALAEMDPMPERRGSYASLTR